MGPRSQFGALAAGMLPPPRAPVGTIGQHDKRLPSGRDSPGIGGRDRHRSSQSQRGPSTTAGAGRNGSDNGPQEVDPAGKGVGRRGSSGSQSSAQENCPGPELFGVAYS